VVTPRWGRLSWTKACALAWRLPVVSLRGMLTLLIILLVLSAVFGGWGHRRWGYTGWSPLGIVVVLLLVMWLTGNLR